MHGGSTRSQQMKASLFCVGPCIGGAHPGQIELFGKNTLPWSVARTHCPRDRHTQQRRPAAQAETLPFLETATASSQVPGTGGYERSCSATLIAPVPWTTAGNKVVKATVKVWEDSSIALWNPHLQQHNSFSLNCERTWLLFRTLWKRWEIRSDCQHPFMLSLRSWHLANKSKSKKQGWSCRPAEPACLNWNPTSRLREVVSGVHKQSPCQCKCASNTCNRDTPSCTCKGLVVRVEKLLLVVYNNMYVQKDGFPHVRWAGPAKLRIFLCLEIWICATTGRTGCSGPVPA